MKPSKTRRYRRARRPVKSDGAFFKKESVQEQSFFGESAHDAFFRPALSQVATPVQRKCDHCAEEEKTQRKEDKKEEEKEKKLMRAPDKKEEDDKKLQRATDKKEEDDKKLQRAPDKKEEDDKKLQRATDKKEEDDKKLQRAHDKKEEEDKKPVQKKEAGSASPTTSVSSYVGSLSGGGQSLPPQTNQFFSARMGYDFSDVKIHTDKEAAESAKDINAKAYTTGNHIVFNEGQYNDSSDQGKRLLAHELTHVAQNKASGHSAILQRAITYTAPAESRKDPIPMVLSSTQKTLGKTFPKFNGTIITTRDQAIRILGPLFIDNITLRYDAQTKSCKVNVKDINLDISADVQKLTLPSGKWTGIYAGSLVKNCEKSPTVDIEMDAIPSGAAAFEQRIADDEKEHVDDLNTVAKKHFDPFYSYLSGISLPSVSGKDCAALYVAEIGTKDADMIKAFLSDWLAAVALHDNAGGNHHHSTVTDNRNCNLVKITANF